jgi:hypothetical protein
MLQSNVLAALFFNTPQLSPEYSCGKRNLLYPILASSVVTIVMYLHVNGYKENSFV